MPYEIWLEIDKRVGKWLPGGTRRYSTATTARYWSEGGATREEADAKRDHLQCAFGQPAKRFIVREAKTGAIVPAASVGAGEDGMRS